MPVLGACHVEQPVFDLRSLCERGRLFGSVSLWWATDAHFMPATSAGLDSALS